MAAVRTAESSATYRSDAPASPPGWANAALCALAPGFCIANAASAGAASAAEAASEARALAGGAASSLAGDFTDAITAAGEPIAETSSAIRYVSVAATVVTVAIVIAIIAVLVRTYA